MRLAILLPDGSPPAQLPIELCLVSRPLLRASFCSQPLYSLGSIHREVPFAIEDWLLYHLFYLGFERGDVYDLDGSVAEVLGAQTLAALGAHDKLVYRARWPGNLSANLEQLSREHPYCTETWAYAHCLTTHRAISRWVLLLHSPDEYLLAPQNHEAGGLVKVLRGYERGLLEDEPVALMRVKASSFARGGGGAEDEASSRGFVLAASRLRGALRYLHAPFLDPFLCVCAGPHTCYSEAETEFPGLVVEVEPQDLVVHHYVEMLPRNVGRCAQQHKACAVPDFSAAHVVSMLRGL